MDKFCQQNGAHPRLGVKVRVLSGAAKRICEIARKMNARQKTDTLQWASYTYPALTGLSEIFITWRLLDMAIIADRRLNRSGDAKDDFYQGKVLQATLFFRYYPPPGPGRYGNLFAERSGNNRYAAGGILKEVNRWG